MDLRVAKFTKRLRSMMSARPRTRAIRAVLEPLERRILLSWIGATTGNTNDAAHLYNNTANWAGGVIDNSFAGVTLTGATTLYFNAGLTTGAGGLNLGYSGNYDLTLESSSTTTQTLTLAGGISGTFGGSSVTIGDPNNNLNVDLGATGQTFTISTGNTLSILNVISDTGGLTEAGAGTLTLCGANTFSGGTTLSAGQLNVNGAAAIGTGTLTLNGGTIDNTSGSAITLSTNNAQTWGASFTFGGTNDLNLGTGAVTLGVAGIQLTTNAGNLTVGGNIGDGGDGYGLIKSGANGTLTLSGNNTFSGPMTFTSGSTGGHLNIDSATALGLGTFTINSGTTLDNTSSGSITVSNIAGIYWGGNFTFAGTHDLNFGAFAVTMNNSHTVTLTTGTLTFGGVISGVGEKLSEAGNGALVLSGANQYTGGVGLNSGTLDINNASALGVGGTFTIKGGTIDNTSSGSITVSTANPMTWSSDFTFAGTEPLDLGSGTVTISANRTVTVSASTLTVDGLISSSHALIKAGNGALTLTATDTTLTGTVQLNAGTLNINSAKAIGTGRLLIDGGTIDNTSGGAITLSTNNLQTWGASFAFGGTNDLNLGTGAVTLGATIQLTTNAGHLTVGGNIGDGGSGYGITKAGAGTLILSGSNTFGGATTLSTGTLDINSAAAIGTGTFAINGGTIDNTSGSAITLSNNNVQTWGGDFAFAGTNALNLGTGAVTLGASRNVTIDASTLTVGGAIGDGSDGYGLTEAGAGTLTLSGANTFTGGTTLSAGTLNI
ncbi:MAG: autotransporter-associated beta strand repeat-containing protein, partial [Tepidisphaeraceae bacterium]